MEAFSAAEPLHLVVALHRTQGNPRTVIRVHSGSCVRVVGGPAAERRTGLTHRVALAVDAPRIRGARREPGGGLEPHGGGDLRREDCQQERVQPPVIALPDRMLPAATPSGSWISMHG
jgi:hypothetical protein